MTAIRASERVLGQSAGPMAAATHIRSTVVVASRLSIRDRDLDERYFGLLDPQFHEPMRGLIAGGWLGMDVALAHYAAADRLGLAAEEQRAIGRAVAQRVQDSYLGGVIRSLRLAGTLNVKTVLTSFPLVWSRLVRGGGSRVVELGPKDVRVEMLMNPIARYRYVREGWAGMFEGTLSLVSRSVYVQETPQHRDVESCAYRISWV